MDWWLWILLGLALLAVEVITPGGFHLLFFGAAALVVGTLVALGLGSVAVQWLLFSIGSVASLLLFRQRLLALFRSPEDAHEVDSLRGEVAVLLDDLPVAGVGRAELRGTTWSVRNAAGRDLRAGERCLVERVDGLSLWLKPE
jgi:membrane protein implicated in regulation of membrane protease activity